MKVAIRLIAAMSVACMLPACATVTRGTTEEFTIESSPPGAAVRTSSGFTCVATPCTFKMPRKEAFEVTVSKAGFKDSSALVDSKMSGGGAAGLAGNVVVGGLIGAGIDATSGALNDLTPNPLHLTLEAIEVAEVAEEEAEVAEVTEETVEVADEMTEEPVVEPAVDTTTEADPALADSADQPVT